VVAAVVAVYAWALGRGFTSEDFLLLRVLGERPPWRDLAAAFTEPWLGITVVGFYRPLGTLALAAERALFGARPAGYLAVHVALHALNAVLVLWLARRMLGGGPAAGSGGAAVRGPARRSTGTGSSGRPVEAGQESPGAVARATAALPPDSPVSPVAGRPSLLRVVPAGSPAALAAALLVVLYPLHPNAVVWVASYATLFAAAAVFGCVLAYRRAREQGGWGWWFGALALFAAALGCYEAAVVLPVVLAATDLLAPAVVWGGSREQPERATGAEAASPVAPGWLVVLPFFALAVVYLLLRRLVVGEVMGGYESFGARLLAPEPGRVAADLALSVLRFHLPVYARPAGAVAAWAAVVLLVAVPLAWLVLSARRRRRAAAGATEDISRESGAQRADRGPGEAPDAPPAAGIEGSHEEPSRVAGGLPSSGSVTPLLRPPHPARASARAGGLRGWLFGWVWALAFMAPYAFQPAVPGNGRYWYLPAAGLAIALAALAADVATALARRSAATAGTSRAHLATGQLLKDQALLTNARLDLERYRTLLAQDSIAKQQVDTQASLVRQYEGAIATDQGQVDNAKLQLSYTRVTAPIAGRLGLRQVDSGNMIRATDANGLVVITQVQPIDVVFPIPESDLPRVQRRLREGDAPKLELYDRNQTRKLASGRLITIDNQIDTATGTIKLKGTSPNEDGALFPNQFVNVRVLLETLTGVTVVPSAAIQRGAAGTFVYVVGPDNTVAVNPVKPGPIEGERAVIESGVMPGDVLVVDGTDRLREGARVEPVPRDTTQPPGGASPRRPRPAGSAEGGKKDGAANDKGGRR
jgi:multidrug efflux system membrane fusion protein